MNDYDIKLVENKQPSYGPIYSLSQVELKTWKTYIKIYFKTGFIQSSKSLARALILFKRKSNRSFCFCINYQGLNNLTL